MLGRIWLAWSLDDFCCDITTSTTTTTTTSSPMNILVPAVGRSVGNKNNKQLSIFVALEEAQANEQTNERSVDYFSISARFTRARFAGQHECRLHKLRRAIVCAAGNDAAADGMRDNNSNNNWCSGLQVS